MAQGKITFLKLQEFISRYDFENLEKKHFSGRNAARGLSQMAQFKIIAYGILEGLKTLRDCVTRFNSHSDLFYHLGIKKAIPLSTLSEANTKRSSAFYQELFFSLLDKTKRKVKQKFELALKILDSTTITIADKRAAWAKFRKDKFGIKVHVLIDQALTLVEDVKITTANASDITIAKTFEFQKENLYVMDRAYFDAAWLYKLNKNGVFFALRLKRNVVYVTLEETIVNGPNIVAIKKIQFLGPQSEKYCDHLRLIILRDEKTEKTIEVITNNFTMESKQISAIYRMRWDIELFFRWLKQNLQVKRFYGRSENAMKSQIWIAMIVYLLLWNLHKLADSNISFLDFLRRFKSRLLQKGVQSPRRCHFQFEFGQILGASG